MIVEFYSRSGGLNTRKPSRFWVKVSRWLNWELPFGARSAVAKW